MAIISKPYTFSAGATIIASEHNSNFDTVYNDYNGNITNSNIASGASIAATKLSLSTIAQNVSFTGNVRLTQNDTLNNVFYSSGTSVVSLLTPGTSCRYLSSGTTTGDFTPVYRRVDLGSGVFGVLPQANGGTGSTTNNPSGLSNALFSFSGQVDGVGYIVGTTLTTTASSNYAYWADDGSPGGTPVTVITSRWVKIAGVSTVTVYASIWQNNAGADHNCTCTVNIGSASGSVTGSNAQQTPEWKTFTIDVSGLTNGTVYTVTIQLHQASGQSGSVYLGSIIAFGS